MPAAPFQNNLYARASEFVRRVGLPVVVLLVALIFDLFYTTSAALDDYGPRWVDFGLLPGIFAMAGCAIWARKRAALAGAIGVGVLFAAALFIRALHIPAYSSVLPNLSSTETVAGVEMVYYVVRRAHPGVAFTVVSGLVVGALGAVTARSPRYASSSMLVQAYLFGFLLLVGAVAVGIAARHKGSMSHASRLTLPTRPRWLSGVTGRQWPLIGMLGFTLLLEFGFTSGGSGLAGVPVLLCSIGAAVLAVLSPRRPADATLAVSLVLLVSALVTPVLGLRYTYEMPGGLAPTQILAGMGVVVSLVRSRPMSDAWPRITVLSGVVAIAAVLNGGHHPFYLITSDRGLLGSLIFAALLLLGISITIGMLLRSRASERTQILQSAVADAQIAERMALARELHDVVAHHVTGIVVQAQAARLMGEKNPQVAVEAMGRIEDAGVEALTAMRRLVRSMRGDAPAGSSEFSEQATTDLAADLNRLVEGVTNGVPTTLRMDLPPDLPHEVGRSALRLVQESLTNVGKHASGATEALVLAEVTGGELHLQVTDDGRESDRRPAGGSGGYGLVGMRERVALLHGRLTAGRAPGGGWRVEAWLPLEGEE